MNSNFYKSGYDLTIENAKCLIRVSNSAAETNDFGIACSLNILAAEEALKALFLIIKHYNPNGTINNFDKIFRFHSIKHEELKRVIKFQEMIQERNEKFLSSLEPTLKIINQMTEDYKIKNVEVINSLNDDYIWFKKQTEKKIDFEEILIWLKDANNDKNQGLYVDKIDDKWISPKQITTTKFLKEKKYTESIIDYVITVEEVFIRVQNSAKTSANMNCVKNQENQ